MLGFICWILFLIISFFAILIWKFVYNMGGLIFWILRKTRMIYPLLYFILYIVIWETKDMNGIYHALFRYQFCEYIYMFSLILVIALSILSFLKAVCRKIKEVYYKLTNKKVHTISHREYEILRKYCVDNDIVLYN